MQCLLDLRASLVAQRLKRLPAMRETWVQSLGQEDPLEKEMATHSSILAWRIPWMEEPGGLQSTGSQRVIQDLATEQHTPHPHWTILAWRFFRSQSKQNQNSEFKVFLSWFQSPHFTLSTWIHSCVYPSVQVESESESEVAQSCPILSDPMDCSPPSSSVPGILQARVLEWGTIAFSRYMLRSGIVGSYGYF